MDTYDREARHACLENLLVKPVLAQTIILFLRKDYYKNCHDRSLMYSYRIQWEPLCANARVNR